jgi:hypothetical protein
MSQEDYMFLKLFKVIWEYKIWIWIFCNKINNFFFLSSNFNLFNFIYFNRWNNLNIFGV